MYHGIFVLFLLPFLLSFTIIHLFFLYPLFPTLFSSSCFSFSSTLSFFYSCSSFSFSFASSSSSFSSFFLSSLINFENFATIDYFFPIRFFFLTIIVFSYSSSLYLFCYFSSSSYISPLLYFISPLLFSLAFISFHLSFLLQLFCFLFFCTRPPPPYTHTYTYTHISVFHY